MQRLLLAIAFLVVPAMVAAETRAAFVVGNSAYEYAPRLDNPGRDARLIAATLEELSFDVDLHQDLTRDGFAQALSAFLRDHAEADVTLFYFAGHGMQYEGRNYLVGTDARLATELDIDGEATRLDQVLDLLERRSKAALVFVDACRDNPLADRFYREFFSETRALATRGLAPLETSSLGSMVVFAASPGQVAYDGGEGNSPFAKALARHLPAENVEVLSLMKRVIADVKRETGERQVPMVTNDLTREIYLRLGEGSPGAALAAQQEQAMFDAALALNTPRAWDLFLQRHPNGGLRDMAVLAREGLTAARLAEASEVEADEDGRISVSREVARTEEEGLGLSREDARAVQAALNARGYDAGPEDGQIGTRTRRAVADFQAAAGLPSTGVVTAGTAGALGLELVASESRSAPVISSPNARRYDPDVLAQVEDDPRLLKAVRVLEGKEFVYGFYEGRLYIGLLTWAHESFDEAQARAERAGGYLAALTTEAENAFAFDLVKDDRRFWWNCGECPDRFGPAFGLYQIEDAREPDGGFVWVTGEPVAFTAWNPGEPGNHNGNEYFATFHWQAWAHRTGAPSHASERWGDLPDSGKSILIEIE